MFKITKQAIVQALADQNDWVAASYLADRFHVTTRTIRNHVRHINEAEPQPIIESSYRGYKLSRDIIQSAGGVIPSQAAEEPSSSPSESRRDYLLRRFLGSNGAVSIYDLADELYVSDSTIQAAVKQVRDFISPFGLKLNRNRDQLALEGTERDKRKLINRLICDKNPETFASIANEQLLNRRADSAQLVRIVNDALRNHNLTSNDYGLNNIVLHLSVMIDRISRGKTVSDDVDMSRINESDGFAASQEICGVISPFYGIEVSKGEQYYFALIISLNTQSETRSFALENNPASSIEEADMQLAQTIVEQLERTYCLEPFDGTFIMRLAVHFHSLKQRISEGTFVRNPLAKKTKNTYPLIYDMAVFTADAFSRATGLSLNEDEMAFLAFHIGGYFENNLLYDSKVTCTLLYVSYHDMHQALIDRINKAFGDQIVLTDVSSVAECDPAALRSDVVLSPVPLNASIGGELVLLDPIPSDRDIERIQKAVAAARSRRMEKRVVTVIQRFLQPDLFKREYYRPDREDMIRSLVDECVEKNLCGPSFFNEVMQREALSPTAFGNQVAVPHTISSSAHQSFLSLVVNEQPIAWGDQQVNIILLIGFSENNRSEFKVLFDDLLNILSNQVNVNRLLKCADYDDFVLRLKSMIITRHTSE